MHERIGNTGERLRVRVRWAWLVALLGSAVALVADSEGRDRAALGTDSHAGLDMSGMRDLPEEDEEEDA